MVNVRELFEAERLMHRILSEESHPAFNKNHPHHSACKKAFWELNKKITAARVELAAMEKFR
jgi:hypothetical protein